MEVVETEQLHRLPLPLWTSALKHLKNLFIQICQAELNICSNKDVSPSLKLAVVGLLHHPLFQVQARWLLRDQSVWNLRHLPLSHVLQPPGHAQIFTVAPRLDRPSVLMIWLRNPKKWNLPSMINWANNSKCCLRSKLKKTNEISFKDGCALIFLERFLAGNSKKKLPMIKWPCENWKWYEMIYVQPSQTIQTNKLTILLHKYPPTLPLKYLQWKC